MRGLKPARFCACVAVLLCGNAQTRAGETLRLHDLGPFQFRAPSGMVLSRRGADSLAGVLADQTLHINYDFGLNADPLKTAPQGAQDFQVRNLTLDGLPAHSVTYSAVDASGQLLFCSGIHVPQVSLGSMGWTRLTLLACGADAGSMERSQAIFSTLRLRTAAH
jgi:hypothetical protein